MGSCISQQPAFIDGTQAMVLDVQKIIADSAWRDFCGSKLPWWERQSLKRKDHTIKVPMHFYRFEETGQELCLKECGDGDSGDVSPGQTGKNLTSEKDLPQRNKTKPQHKGLYNYFTNDTEEPQVYQFNFVKTRRSSARVNYQKGFSFGGATNFSLELPKILPGGEFGAELDMHMEVTKTEEQAFGEESTTAIASDVTVSPLSVCVANVILEDTHFTATFKVHVIMRMPTGTAETYIYNKHGELVRKSWVTRLDLLFPKAYHVKDSDGRTRPDVLQFVVEGVINASQISNQRIQLDSKPL